MALRLFDHVVHLFPYEAVGIDVPVPVIMVGDRPYCCMIGNLRAVAGRYP